MADINIGDLILSRIFPQYSHLKLANAQAQALEQQQTQRDQTYKDLSTFMGNRTPDTQVQQATPNPAYNPDMLSPSKNFPAEQNWADLIGKPFQPSNLPPEVGRQENITQVPLSETPDFRNKTWAYLNANDKLAEVLAKQNTPESFQFIETPGGIFSLNKSTGKQQGMIPIPQLPPDESKIYTQIDQGAYPPEVISAFEKSGRKDRSVFGGKKIGGEAFKTPLPSTDKGWTLSANKEGLTVARMQDPATGKIVEQPYNPQSHGRIVDPKEGVGLADNVNPALSGEASMQNYTPQVQTLAKKLVAGEIPYPSAFALKDPLWKTVIQASADLDPGFNAQQYQIRQNVRKSFTSGQDAKNVTSINTLVGHLDSLKKSAERLNNSDLQIWNKLANYGITQTGDARVTKFNMDLGAVESELATVFKQTGATDQEIKAWRERINSSQSPEQLRANINEAVTLMGSRLEALHNKYTSAMGPFSQFQILSPKSRKILSGIVGADAVEQLEPAQTQPQPTQSPVSTQRTDNKSVTVQIPKEAIGQLKQGHYTTFGNGQTWTLDAKGIPQRIK